MSDTEGMVRLMEFAAEKLKANLNAVAGRQYDTTIGRAHLDNVIAAMSYARAILQMVAASVAPERSSAAADLRAGYEAWAEGRDNAAILGRSEIESVARFLIGAE